MHIFYLLLYQPLFNALIILYEWIPGHNLGVAIIALTVIVDVLLAPAGIKGLKSQLATQKIQPKLREIQKKYKDDREKQVKATMELYKSEKVNPFSGIFILLFVELPIFFAIYRVFWKGITSESLAALYSFVPHPGMINSSFLSINLAHASVTLAIIAGILQYIQIKMTLPETPKKEKKKKGDFSNMFTSEMSYIAPAVIVIILLKLPSALGLYLIVSSIFMIAEQYFVLKRI